MDMSINGLWQIIILEFLDKRNLQNETEWTHAVKKLAATELRS